MTPEFEARLQKAVDDGIIPGAILLARDKSGKINYSHAVGRASSLPSPTSDNGGDGDSNAPPPPPPPLSPGESVLALASMTKLLTAVAVLQLVERGELSLDEDVAARLPGLAAQPVLAGGGGGDEAGPVREVPRTKPILLRQLLAHTSGAAYVFLDGRLTRWWRQQQQGEGREVVGAGRTVEERFGYPLVFQPGDGWAYGSGLDWAGRLVEVVTGMGLEEYVRERVLDPVGVSPGGLTFYPGRDPRVVERLAGMTRREEGGEGGGGGGRVVHVERAVSGVRGQAENEALGGEGLYGSLAEYMKVVYSLLVDDGKLLRPETARLLFEPLLEREPEAKRQLVEQVERAGWMVGWMPPLGDEYDWSPGGLLVNGDSHPYRKRGFLQWGGAFNLCWFIDRAAGVCGVFGTQVLQPGDPLVRSLMKEFEEQIYAKL